MTVIQRGPRLLPHFDGDLVDWLMPRFRELGISVHTGATVTSVQQSADGLVVHTKARDTRDLAVIADLAVHAAGRVPDLEALDLAAGGVAVENGRLQLNGYMQSKSNPRVYAAGDAAGVGPPLTPVSSHDAQVVSTNLLEGPSTRPDYRGVPSVAFTVPPIAAVGLREEQARQQGLRFRVNAVSTPDWFTARRLNERIYAHKVLIEQNTDQILGAHIVGPQADEIINLFALAIRHRLTTDNIKNTMFAYPTGASDIGYML